MKNLRIERLAYEIISGTRTFKVVDAAGDHLRFSLRAPDPEIRVASYDVYEEVYQECLDNDFFTEEEIQEIILEEGIWDQSMENRSKKISRELEDIKVAIFKNFLNENKVKALKIAARESVREINKLWQIKHQLDVNSAEGIAEMEKNKFQIANSLYFNGAKWIDEWEYWASPYFVVEQVFIEAQSNLISESDYRAVARNEPWRSYWSGKKGCSSIFNVPASLLTDEQKNLLVWSTVYDNIYESSECPSNDIINDDDALDGWFIVQRRKREGEKAKEQADEFLKNNKIRSAGEVFIPSSDYKGYNVTGMEVDKIDGLNDLTARITKKQRANAIKSKGQIHEAEMPDSKVEISRLFNQGMKRG